MAFCGEVRDNMNKILISDDKFKSLMISLNYILPLDEKEAGRNALVALVLQQGCDKYRSEKEIEIALAALYNATVSVNIDKLGDSYSITFSLDILNKKYIERDILGEALDILKNIIYVPYIENAAFCKSYIEREKESLISRINELKNNKKKYAISRLEQEIFDGEAYSVSRLGRIEDIEKETAESVYVQYLKIINQSEATVVVSGNIDGYDNIMDTITDKIGMVSSNFNVEYVENKRKKEGKILKNIEEYEELNQSILCMGLRFNDVSKEDFYKISRYNAIMGETPASKLFQNVREKESLAYNASSQYIRFKQAIYIYTGIDILNLEKAKQIITCQIEDMKNGNISDEELEAAKRHSISKIKLIKDSKDEIAMYTIANNVFFEGEDISIEDIEEKIKNVSKEQVIEVANKAYIDTIYLLGGKK